MKKQNVHTNTLFFNKKRIQKPKLLCPFPAENAVLVMRYRVASVHIGNQIFAAVYGGKLDVTA